MEQIAIRAKSADDEVWLKPFLDEHWGGPEMIVRGARIDALDLPALVAGGREGIAIFRRTPCAELILLHSLRKRRGIGSALLDRVVADVRANGASELLVMTTNDNLPALRFYQRHGFRLASLAAGAVDAARRLKPAIPLLGFDGIPIRDELQLVLPL